MLRKEVGKLRERLLVALTGNDKNKTGDGGVGALLEENARLRRAEEGRTREL